MSPQENLGKPERNLQCCGKGGFPLRSRAELETNVDSVREAEIVQNIREAESVQVNDTNDPGRIVTVHKSDAIRNVDICPDPDPRAALKRKPEREKLDKEEEYSPLYQITYIHTYLAETPEIGQDLGRFLICGASKQEQT